MCHNFLVEQNIFMNETVGMNIFWFKQCEQTSKYTSSYAHDWTIIIYSKKATDYYHSR